MVSDKDKREQELTEAKEAEYRAKYEALLKARAKEAAMRRYQEEQQAKAKEEAIIRSQEEQRAKAKEAAELKLQEERKAAAEEELRARAKEAAIKRFETEKKSHAKESEKEKLRREMQEQAKEIARLRILAESKAREEKLKEAKQKQIASAYAKYLRDNHLKPGDVTTITPEMLGVELPKRKKKQISEIKDEDILQILNENKRKQQEKIESKKINITRPDENVVAVNAGRQNGITKLLARTTCFFDDVAESIDGGFRKSGYDLQRELHNIVMRYKGSTKQIWMSIFSVFLMCAVLVIILDKSTVYEYAYNGKVLGYVQTQDDVTNVLEIAGEGLNEINNENDTDIEFSTKENISFRKVDGTGKDVDDVDTTVNKLAYMTDIEVEGYGIYDGGKLVTIVDSEKAAEKLLDQVMDILGSPDDGMKLISAEFSQPLEIKTVNVLLTSVQSNDKAIKQMTKGGEVKYYHLVSDGETLETIQDTFGVDEKSIYDEDNKNALTEVETGEKVCIRKTATPVSVKLVETGKMKEIVPYEIIKKDSAEYYIGDEVIGVEGVDGVQIFEGTLTKVGGKAVARDTISLEVITEKVDQIVYVGTTKRPKEAPTGIFKNPMKAGTYVVTSLFGRRWGRQHAGIDLGAPTGTDIFASDGGTVIRASYYGGYGLCVDIDNGYTKDGQTRVTRYGHMSSVGVSVGQKVYQGQYIGDVGSTGRSTGPHLHFETIIGGVQINPINQIEGSF